MLQVLKCHRAEKRLSSNLTAQLTDEVSLLLTGDTHVLFIQLGSYVRGNLRGKEVQSQFTVLIQS